MVFTISICIKTAYGRGKLRFVIQRVSAIAIGKRLGVRGENDQGLTGVAFAVGPLFQADAAFDGELLAFVDSLQGLGRGSVTFLGGERLDGESERGLVIDLVILALRQERADAGPQVAIGSETTLAVRSSLQGQDDEEGHVCLNQGAVNHIYLGCDCGIDTAAQQAQGDTRRATRTDGNTI